VNIHSRGQKAIVTGDMMHHAIQCREPDWCLGVDWDPKQAVASRRRFPGSVADTGTLLMPIHFPSPTVGLVTSDGDRFHYRYKRD
jgi:glyoxylase-like metal-dependent hydrolase (beta-lactamase superfamily II)